MRSVSVVILRGIKLRMMIFRGRMSCDEADSESFTKMFSFFNASTAGKFDGMFSGMFSSSFLFHCKDNTLFVLINAGAQCI